jgi:DNA ligase (NAD+)
VITGTLEAFTRDEAAAALEGKGAKVVNSVSGKTTGLIIGEEPGNSKLTKARKLEVPLLTEQELVELLAG